MYLSKAEDSLPRRKVVELDKGSALTVHVNYDGSSVASDLLIACKS